MDDSKRIFSDDSGREWVVERVGRTSGIVTHKGSVPAPADILRFTCKSDPEEGERETTMPPGSLDHVPLNELLEMLKTARRLPARPL